ncbi:MAG: AAA family ATPase, partial [Desulfovibrio sp.]|nr:AAA family ATPase [Desulfovibrio sp.]
MLKSLRLKNFKCFSDQTIALAPFTLLSGVNGMGKSSTIQALLALRQSSVYGCLHKELQINGELIHLGSVDDVVFENANENSIAIVLEIQKANQSSSKQNYSFAVNDDSKQFLRIQSETNNKNTKTALFSDKFVYLEAERIGPRISHAVPSPVQAAYNLIGCGGEFCAYMLFQHESRNVPNKKLCLRQESQGKLLMSVRSQVELWLSKVGQEARLSLQYYPQMDLVSLLFSFISQGVPTKDYKPTHVGFGLSYVLPIFTAVLTAPRGALFLIENPEAHLHPKGQSIMGEFLALAASCGMQVIVESHSDHL